MFPYRPAKRHKNKKILIIIKNKRPKNITNLPNSDSFNSLALNLTTPGPDNDDDFD
jgi:hypothetical protein